MMDKTVLIVRFTDCLKIIYERRKVNMPEVNAKKSGVNKNSDTNNNINDSKSVRQSGNVCLEQRTDITSEKKNIKIPNTLIPGLVAKQVEKACRKFADKFAEVCKKLEKITQQRFVAMDNMTSQYDTKQNLLFADNVNTDAFANKYYNNIPDYVKQNKTRKIDSISFSIASPSEVLTALENLNEEIPFIGKGNLSIEKPQIHISKESGYDHWHDYIAGYDGNNIYLIRISDKRKGLYHSFDAYIYAIIPYVHRFTDSPEPSCAAKTVKIWLLNKLKPAVLSKKIKAFIDSLNQDVYKYIRIQNSKLQFDLESFIKDTLDGKCRYLLDIDRLMNEARTGKILDLDGFKQFLMDCDYKRANLSPYTEKQITDLNLGHWELFEEDEGSQCVEAAVPEGEHFVARPPQMDVVQSGVCGIDFGTKSTVVAYLKNEARLLRVGEGDYTKAPEQSDYENPTVIELRDFAGFCKAYNERQGRPFTEWEQVTVSHQAAEAIFNADEESTYYSVFSELKQWAIDKKRRLMLCDKKGRAFEVKPYLELQEEDFDPIEAYAYYLGLYINNMNNGIYLHYMLSFPVNYELEVRQRLLQSFERGLKKSLPPALLKDAAVMKKFKINAGASEPAAYAISALQEFGLEPENEDEKVCYCVFDFGGGTTDFDFGTEEIPADGRNNYVLTQFGSGGDVFLGGENLLQLLAYEVYKDNLAVMREHQIPFVLPPKGELFSGAETLIYGRGEGSQQAYLNIKRLAENLRPVWERKEGYREEFTKESYAMHFLTNTGEIVEIQLKVDVDKLEKCIHDQIESGIQNFFTAMRKAVADRDKNSLSFPIHIFLAGNSSKSPVVKELFEKYIAAEEKNMQEENSKKKGIKVNTDKCFQLHLPLGTESGGQKEEAAGSMEFDKIHTGKTGVVFGLLRSRKGARDVKIENLNNDANNEVQFRYLLGKQKKNCFEVTIGQDVKYGDWAQFIWADLAEFDIFYTSEPKALEGKMPITKVTRMSCEIDGDDVDEDGNENKYIFIRKAAPDKIEYTVASAEELKNYNEEEWKKTHKIYAQMLKD